MTKLHNDYYTYAYLREDKTPYYIGKGRGKRAYDKRRAIKPPTDKSRILFLKKGLTEAEAFKHEVYMIFVLGRKDLGTGILRNLTNGGEGSSGHTKSEESKKKIGEAHSGVPKTEEHKKKISETNTGMFAGEKNHQFGVPRTEEVKKKISETNTGMFAGEKNPNYGNTGALNPLSKAIIAIEPGGTEWHFSSGTEAARELTIPRRSLSRWLKPGKQPKWGKFKGWQFFYKNSEES